MRCSLPVAGVYWHVQPFSVTLNSLLTDRTLGPCCRGGLLLEHHVWPGLDSAHHQSGVHLHVAVRPGLFLRAGADRAASGSCHLWQAGALPREVSLLGRLFAKHEPVADGWLLPPRQVEDACGQLRASPDRIWREAAARHACARLVVQLHFPLGEGTA